MRECPPTQLVARRQGTGMRTVGFSEPSHLLAIALICTLLSMTEAIAGNDADGRKVRVGDRVHSQAWGCLRKEDLIETNELVSQISVRLPITAIDRLNKQLADFRSSRCDELDPSETFYVVKVDEDSDPHFPLACIRVKQMIQECLWTNQLALTHRRLR